MSREIIRKVALFPPRSINEIPARQLFLCKYGVIPRRITIIPVCGDIQTEALTVFHVKSILNRVLINENNGFSVLQRGFHPCSKQCYVRNRLVPIPDVDGVMMHLDGCRWVTNFTSNSNVDIEPDYDYHRHFLIVEEVHLFYLAEHEAFVQRLAVDLANDKTLSLTQPKTATLRLIGQRMNRCGGPGNFYLTGYTYVKKPRIDDLTLSYGGRDFLIVHEKIVAWLNKKNTSGLVLLYGAPGSGKTHYIRYLLHQMSIETERTLVYIPADMIAALSAPSLLPLLLSHPNSLLIIEDAEGSLSRSHTSSHTVSNLLNLSDGLLGDGVHVQIVATFNCSIESLDSALLRPGRLIARHCFPSILDIGSTRRLAESIGVPKTEEINEPLSLANIYAMRGDKVEEDQDEATPFTCSKCSSIGGGEQEE